MVEHFIGNEEKWEKRRFDGVIEGINDYVDFQTSNIADVEKEFHCAVDDYLIFCSEVGKEPEKEYKGTFNVRIKPELHKKLAFKALEDGDSLNKAVEKAIAVYLSDGRANDINKDIKRSLCVEKEYCNGGYEALAKVLKAFTSVSRKSFAMQ